MYARVSEGYAGEHELDGVQYEQGSVLVKISDMLDKCGPEETRIVVLENARQSLDEARQRNSSDQIV